MYQLKLVRQLIKPIAAIQTLVDHTIGKSDESFLHVLEYTEFDRIALL